MVLQVGLLQKVSAAEAEARGQERQLQARQQAAKTLKLHREEVWDASTANGLGGQILEYGILMCNVILKTI